MRDRLDAWLSAGGTIRIVPAGAFAVAVLLGIIPMWLEFGAFPHWAPRERVGTPLLVAWIAGFLLTEVLRLLFGGRGSRRWAAQYRDAELERADQLAGAADRLCALLTPDGRQRVAVDQVRASLLQGIVDTVRVMAELDPGVKLNASLLVPEPRREGRRNVDHLTILCRNRVGERGGWASFSLEGRGPVQDTYRDGRFRVVTDTRAESVRGLLPEDWHRSMMAMPVVLRALGGTPLAIVAVEASAPAVFTDAVARSLLEPMVAPHLKLIALSLIFEQRPLTRPEAD